jgi:parallel beta-helix repeat protein
MSRNNNGLVKKRFASIFIVWWLIWGGFFGFLIFEDAIHEGSVEAANIIVDWQGAGDYLTIQDAIDNAKSGDIIYVWAGEYRENLNVNIDLTLQGNGTTNTIINGTWTGDVVYITADWVNISGFTITNSGNTWGDAGIELYNVENCKINETDCSNNNCGIYLYSSSNNIIENTTCNSNSQQGIYFFFGSNNNKLINTTCHSNNYGIYIFMGDDNEIINCTCHSNNFGIYIYLGDDNEIINCTCHSNNFGIYIYLGDDNEIINCTCYSNNYGIYNYRANYNDIINCTGYSNKYYGIIIYASNILKIINYTCNGNDTQQYGIYVYQGTYISIINSTLDSNYYDGISIYLSSYLEVLNCKLSQNNYTGIRIYSTSFCTLENNNFSECGILIDGIMLEYWNSHSINTNNVVNNKPICYLKNQTNKIIPPSVGQVILANCTDISIKDSNYSKCSVGIEIGFSKNINVSNVTCNDNTYGIYFLKSDNNNISNCSLNSNLNYGIYISNSNRNIIINCTTNHKNLYGLYLFVSEHNKILNCTSNFNTNQGIYNYQARYTIIDNCNFTSNNDIGISIDRSDFCSLTNNTIQKSQRGIYVYFSNYLTIDNCSSNWNALDGIYAEYIRFLETTNCTCNWNNRSGIYINQYERNSIINNNFSNNYYGIQIISLGNSKFENNILNSNLINGVLASSSNNNIFSDNVIINTPIGINLTSSTLQIINTSIINSTIYSMKLLSNTHATALNCTMNYLKIFYEDTFSNLTVQWYMHVKVIDDLSSPVANADVLVRNCTSSVTYSGITDNYGWYRWIKCNEYIENITGKTSIFTPHNISVTKKAYEDAFAEPEPNMDISKIITIILPHDITPPEPPTGLIFTAVAGSYLNFTWTQVITEDVYGYNIYINDTGSSTNYHLLDSTNKTYFNATGLNEETTYHFQIKSFDDVPLESTPLEGSESTLDLTPPEPPSLLVLSSCGGTFLNLTWAKSLSSDAQGYQVFVNDTGSITNFKFLANTINNYFNHTNLVEETGYIYRIRAYDEVPHYSINISLLATTLDITAPIPPSGLMVKNIGGHEMTLTWNPSTDLDVMGYHIFINNTGADASGPFHKLFTLPLLTTQIIIPGLLEETTYYFTIVAFDEVPNDSVYSEVVSGTTLDITAPTAPTGLTAIAISDSEIVLNWNANPEPDIAGYFIYMNASGQSAWGEFQPIHMVIGTETEYTVTGVIEQVIYYFKIKAFDEVPNNSSFSNMAYATVPDISPPSTPTGLKVSNPTNNSLKVSWKANPESDVIGYLLFRAKSISGAFESIKAEPIENSNYIDTDLDENTTYYYKVRAIDDFGLKSGFSDIAMGKTLYGQLPPEINMSIEDFEIMEDSYDDSSINLFDWFKDLNGDKLEFECKGNKHIDVRIYDKTGSVILNPGKNWNGIETLTFIASDGVYNATDDVTITVTPVNDPPEHAKIISPDAGIEIEFGIGLTFTGTYDDPDLPYGDKLTIKWYSDISGPFGNKETLENVILSIGDHLITMEVSDLAGEKTFANLLVNILESPEYDNDNDGMPDSWENSFGLNPDNPNDAKSDSDNDSLSNIEEYNNNTNPLEPDTDSDGLFDGQEILEYYTNPTNADTDNDTYSDGEEILAGTDPLNSSEYPPVDKKSVLKSSPGLNVLGIIISTVIIILIFIILIVFLYMGKFKIKQGKMDTIPSPPTELPKRKKNLKKKAMRYRKRKLKEKSDEEEEEWADEEEEWADEEEEEWEDEEEEWADEEEEEWEDEEEEWADEEEEWEDE